MVVVVVPYEGPTVVPYDAPLCGAPTVVPYDAPLCGAPTMVVSHEGVVVVNDIDVVMVVTRVVVVKSCRAYVF